MRANTSAIGVSGATVMGWRSIARSKGDEQIGPLLGGPAGSEGLNLGNAVIVVVAWLIINFT